MKYSYKDISLVIEAHRLSLIQKYRKHIPTGEPVLIMRHRGRNISHIGLGNILQRQEYGYGCSCSVHVKIYYLNYPASRSNDVWRGWDMDIVIPISKMNKHEKAFYTTLRISNILHPI